MLIKLIENRTVKIFSLKLKNRKKSKGNFRTFTF